MRNEWRNGRTLTDMVVSFFETAVEVVQGIIKFGVFDMELERVYSNNGS